MGKIELDHTGSGSGITLSSDGTDLLLNGTAVGGSVLELYAENPSTPTAPSATGANAVAIGSGASASDTNAVAIGTGSEAGTYSVGIGWDSGNIGPNNVIIGRTSASTYTQGATVIGYNASSSGYSSNQTALGYNAKANTGAQATALTNSYASGADSIAAAIANNTSSYGATGANSVAIGKLAKATNTGSVALYQSTASGAYSFSAGQSAISSNAYSVAIGRSASASGDSSYALGRSSTASGTSSYAIGYLASATQTNAFALGKYSVSSIIGKMAYAGFSFSASGDGQYGKFVLLAETTDATAKAMTTTDGSPLATNQIILPNNTAYAFHGTIVARQQASQGTACAAWKIEGLIRREGSAGTTVLVNSATTVLDNTPAWSMALSADTTNGGLAITVTGAAATNIRWVATIHTSEVTY